MRDKIILNFLFNVNIILDSDNLKDYIWNDWNVASTQNVVNLMDQMSNDGGNNSKPMCVRAWVTSGEWITSIIYLSLHTFFYIHVVLWVEWNTNSK